MNKNLYLIFLKNTPPPRPDTHPHTQPNPSLTFPDLADMGYSDGFQVSPLKRILSSSFPKPLLTSHFFFTQEQIIAFLSSSSNPIYSTYILRPFQICGLLYILHNLSLPLMESGILTFQPI